MNENLYANVCSPSPSYPVYAAVQNGIILDTFDTKEEAKNRVQEELQRDWFSILMKRKLRKLLRKSGNVALHQYHVIKISEVEEIK